MPGAREGAIAGKNRASWLLAMTIRPAASTSTIASRELSSASTSRVWAERRCAFSRSTMTRMLSCMTVIERSSTPVSSAPTRRDRRLQFAIGDAVGDRRRFPQRQDDPAHQQHRYPARQQQGDEQGGNAGVFEEGDRRDDLAAGNKALAGGRLGEQIEAMHDVGRQPIELVAGLRLSMTEPQLVPSPRPAPRSPRSRPAPRRTGTRLGHRQVFEKDPRQLRDPLVDRGPGLRVGAVAARQLLVHLGEVDGGGALEIGRHQRTVVQIDDEIAGGHQDVDAIAAERSGQQSHRNEGAEDRGADRPPSVTPHEEGTVS